MLTLVLADVARNRLEPDDKSTGLGLRLRDRNSAHQIGTDTPNPVGLC